MPTSDHHNITAVLTVAQNLAPRSILDVGCGFGKYGVLLREYLDVWHERYDTKDWKTRIDGIDAFQAYRNPIWEYVYQQVHLGDAREILPTLDGYDLVLICDVIEHLTKADAQALVQQALQRSKYVLVTTPRAYHAQGDVNGNPYEIHRCLFQRADFPSNAQVIEIQCLSCNLYLASCQPLPPQATYTAELSDLVYLRSRTRLDRFGKLSWPLSAGMRTLCRWLA